VSGAFSSLSSGRWAAIAVGIGLAALLPFVYHDPYYMTIIVTAEIVAILNISWSFVLGMAGVWNFGQLAIYALGAYSAGWMMLHERWVPAPLAILFGGLFSACAAVLLAFPTLRLFGIYTSLLTFSFSQIVQYVALNDPGGLTGGSFGFPTVRGLFSSSDQTSFLRSYYWVCLAVIVASCFAVAWLRQSRLGIALRSSRDAPAYTAARGVDPRAVRVAAFGLSGFLAGIAGSLYLCFQQSFTTSQMGLTPMSIDVTMLVIGGLGTVFGPLLGTAVLTVIQTWLIDYPGWQLTVLGAILLVIVIFVPGGLVGAISRLVRRLGEWVAEDEQGGGSRPPAAPSERLPATAAGAEGADS
jgi:branched-chain amino acid transport system permease protein